jgi:hypothetical protein
MVDTIGVSTMPILRGRSGLAIYTSQYVNTWITPSQVDEVRFVMVRTVEASGGTVFGAMDNIPNRFTLGVLADGTPYASIGTIFKGFVPTGKLVINTPSEIVLKNNGDGTGTFVFDGETVNAPVTGSHENSLPMLFHRYNNNGVFATNAEQIAFYNIRFYKNGVLISHCPCPGEDFMWGDISGNGNDFEIIAPAPISSYIKDSVMYGYDLNQLGYSDTENVISRIEEFTEHYNYSGPDNNGLFYASIAPEGIPTNRGWDLHTEKLASATTYTCKLTLRQKQGYTSSPQFCFSAASGTTAVILSGPGTISMINTDQRVLVTGLSESENTVLQVTKSNFSVGVDEVRFNILPIGTVYTSAGDGIGVKDFQICIGGIASAYSNAFSVSKAIHPAATMGKPELSVYSCAFLGDSLTNTYPEIIRGFFPASQIVKANHGGLESDAILPYMQTEVIPSGASHVHIWWGTNDIGNGKDTDHIIANTLTAISQAYSAGLSVSLSTIPPRGGSANWDSVKQGYLTDFNAWAIAYGATNGIAVADAYNHMLQPGTEESWSKYKLDEVHFNAAGNYRIARFFTNYLPITRVSGDAKCGNLQHVGRAKYTPEIVSGTSPADWIIKLPQAPELINTLGLNSIYYDAGTPLPVAYNDFGNGTFTFDGPKGLLVYSIDSSAVADKINKYIGN